MRTAILTLAVAAALVVASADAFRAGSPRPKGFGTHRGERGIVGAPSEIPTDSADLSPLLEFVVMQMNRESNSLMKMVPVKIVSASKQVVAGLLYKITFTAGLSRSCLKDDRLSTVEECPVGDVQQYTADVLVQAWAKESPVKVVRITPNHEAVPDGSVPGGELPVDVSSDDAAQDALEFARKTAETNVAATAPALRVTVTKVVSATKQLVNGLVYDFEFLANVRAEGSNAAGATERITARVHQALGESRPLNILDIERHPECGTGVLGLAEFVGADFVADGEGARCVSGEYAGCATPFAFASVEDCKVSADNA